jgi:hypothetical protein
MAPRRWNLRGIEAGRNPAKAHGAGGLQLRYRGHDVGPGSGSSVHVRLACSGADRCEPLCGHPPTAKLPPSRFRRCQGSLGALTDEASLELGDAGHLRNHKLTHGTFRNCRQIAEHNAGVSTVMADLEKKLRIAGEAVKLGHNKRGVLLAASCQCSNQLGAVSALASLNLSEFSDQFPTSAIEVLGYDFSLSIEAQTRFPLLISTHAVVSDILSMSHCLLPHCYILSTSVERT